MIRRKKRQPVKLPTLLAGFLIIIFGFVFSLKSLSQPMESFFSSEPSNQSVGREEFIAQLVPHAQELQAGYGILPSIILGQACLESNFGQSSLASQYNNLFGVKAYGEQEQVNLETQEFVNQQWLTIQGDFRVYDSWEESMDDHTMLFVSGVDWDVHKYEAVLTAKNYQEAAQALQTAGYATDPTYAEKIIAVIEEYDLEQYD
ncbi:MAG: glycoside hydrolase family 73 protein [Enterococcus sp.]